MLIFKRNIREQAVNIIKILKIVKFYFRDNYYFPPLYVTENGTTI